LNQLVRRPACILRQVLRRSRNVVAFVVGVQAAGARVSIFSSCVCA
jgi:hypothetical protein